MQLALILGATAILIFGSIYYFGMSKKANTNNITPLNGAQTNSPQTSAQQKDTVILTQNGWSPKTLTIKTGETVTWINQSEMDAALYSNPHPVHTDYPPLNLGTFSNGASLSLTFPSAGTYGYHNHLNPNETATIIVQ